VNTFKYSFKAAGIAAVTTLAMSTSAHALTLDTTFLQANSVFSLSQEALDAMSAASTNMSALGNASAATSTTAAFNLPVTKVDVSLGLPPFSPLVTPNWGDATGSALSITRGSRSVVLANFVIDYSKDLVLADITANGVTTKNTSLYSFTATDLKIGLNGLTLNMHQQLSNLVFTDTALASFTSGLNLSKALVTPLKTLDFGTITIDINGALRSPINATPYTAAVPEAPPAAMLGLGLCGIALVARRKMKA
jgi:hypothetical protein